MSEKIRDNVKIKDLVEYQWAGIALSIEMQFGEIQFEFLKTAFRKEDDEEVLNILDSHGYSGENDSFKEVLYAAKWLQETHQLKKNKGKKAKNVKKGAK